MLNVSILTDDIIARMIEINDDDDFDLRTSCDRLWGYAGWWWRVWQRLVGGRLITSMKPLRRLPWEEEKKREGKGEKWRKSRTREEMRGKGRETTWHCESSLEWFGSTCGFDCIVGREGGLILWELILWSCVFFFVCHNHLDLITILVTQKDILVNIKPKSKSLPNCSWLVPSHLRV